MNNYNEVPTLLNIIDANKNINMQTNLKMYYAETTTLFRDIYTSSTVLNRIYNAMTRQNYNILEMLYNLLQYHTKKHIAFNVAYLSYNNTSSITSLADFTGLPTPEGYNIKLVYVPKNKTYIKDLELEEDNTLYRRLKGIENCLIKNTTHYIRVLEFKYSNNTVIITDQISQELIYEIYLQLPNLIKRDTNTTHPIINIFEALYKAYYLHENVEETLATLTKLLTCDLNILNEKLKEFQENLKNLAENQLKYNNDQILTDIKNRIQSLETQLKELYIQQYNQNKICQGLTNLPTEAISNLIELIQNSKYINIIEHNTRGITLDIQAPIKYFNPEDFVAYENNPNSYINRHFTPIELLALHKIFVTQEYKLIVQTIIRLKLNNITDNTPLRIYNVSHNQNKHTTIPNPHIHYYDCWSEARSAIDEALANRNYDLIIPQLIAATQSVNVAESTSFISQLLPDLKNNPEQIKIINPEGNIITWYEYLDEIQPELINTTEEGESNNEEN